MSEMLEILEDLGIEVTGEQGGEIQALCPMHKERTGKDDRNPSWWINSESGLNTCFSCGYSNSLEGLVGDVAGLKTRFGTTDWDAVEEWLAGHRDALKIAAKKLNQRSWLGDLPKPPPMTEARLAVFTDPPRWALKARNLKAKSAAHYGVRWDDKEEAWITPLRDPEDLKLMGWQAKGEGSRFFRNRPPGMIKSRTVFGVDVAHPQMIVVESPLDCVRIHSAGIPGAVAVCGGKISDEQISIIRRAKQIVLAMDNPRLDSAGSLALEKFYETSIRMGIDFYQFAYGDSDAKDPGDMTDKQIKSGLRNMCHSIYGLDALKAA